MMPSIFLAVSASLFFGCSNKLAGDDGDSDRSPPDETDIEDDTDDSGEDLDLDGHLTPDDCDDTDASVFPGAPELCDDKDNDCDGLIPESETDVDGNGVVECEEIC